MLKPSDRIHPAPFPAIQQGARQRALGMLVGALPWLIIAALLWAGLYIKPQPVGATVTPPLIEPRDHFYGLTALPDGTLWAAGSNGKIVAIAGNGRISRLPTPTRQHLQDIAAWDANRAVAVGNGGDILYSADGGASWTLAPGVPRSEVANKLLRVRIADGGLAIASGEMGALLISSDYGQHWRRLRPEEDVSWNDVAILGDGRLVVVGEFGLILTSPDGGASWEEVGSPVESSLMAVSFRNPQQGVAVGLEGALLVTEDGGQSWSPLDSSVQDHLFDVLWDADAQRWFVSGALGRWLSAEPDARHWQAGRIDSRDLSWHTRAVAQGGVLWLAGANIGAFNPGTAVPEATEGPRWSPLRP